MCIYLFQTEVRLNFVGGFYLVVVHYLLLAFLLSSAVFGCL